jgi:predicted transcriptional regulator
VRSSFVSNSICHAFAALRAKAGKSNREIACEVGVDESTVRAITAGKSDSPEIPQPDDPIAEQLRNSSRLAHIFSPARNNWAAALAALRLVNEQISVDALFAFAYWSA